MSTIHAALAAQYIDVINRRAKQHNIAYVDEASGALVAAIACLYAAVDNDKADLTHRVMEAMQSVILPPERAA